MISFKGNSYNWLISIDGANDTFVLKRPINEFDLNGNMNIPMINSCTQLGNTIDVSHGGTGFISITPNGVVQQYLIFSIN